MDPSRNLERFLSPQRDAYPTALQEIREGHKRSHWMWYIFPQLRGLGQSNVAWYYGIEDLEEARQYLAHPVLGQRLREITAVLLTLSETNPEHVFGWPDCMKLCSCMTLFWEASYEELFLRVLDKYYQGQQDSVTLKLLGKGQL